MPGKKSNSSFDKKRRKLLKLLGLGSAVIAGQSAAAQIRVERPIAVDPGFRGGANYISIKLLRPHDLLSLELRYHNFSLSGNLLQKRADPAYLVVIFQPQTISEQAGTEESNGATPPTAIFTPPPLPARLLIGGDSRLVFAIPASTTTIKLDVNELLDWEKYDLVVNERAKQKATRRIAPVINRRISAIQRNLNDTRVTRKIQGIRGISKDEKLMINNILIPETMNSRADAIINMRDNITALASDPVGPLKDLETSLEVPLRLYLSPTKLAGWKHLKKLDPDSGIIKQTNKLFELWHTRMGTKTSKGIDESDLTLEQRIVRALWADDADKKYDAVVPQIDDPVLGITSMSNKDRHRIVHESSNFQIPRFVPPPIKAYKLFLTTLGAWLDSELVVERKKLHTAGVLFGNNNALNVLKWRHIETMGREHYVEIVTAGNILPFGNEAVLIKITERKPHGGTGTATNFQRQIVVITEPIKEYNYHDSGGEFMNFSFSRVEMITTASPLLDINKTALASSLSLPNYSDPNSTEYIKLNGQQPKANEAQFIIISGGKEVLFKIKAEDLAGNMVDFTLPLAFASTDVLGSAANVKALTDAYNNKVNFGNTQFNGQKFTLAPQAENGTDTAFTAYKVTFKTRTYTNAEEPQGFLPTLGEAQIIEPSYQRLTGKADPVSVSLVDDKNAGNVFAKFNTADKIDFSGQTDKTGGLAAPNFNLSGLSKAAGAFGGDIEKFKLANANATDLFTPKLNLPEPKLFGVFKLSALLEFVKNPGDDDPYSLAKPLAQRINARIPNLVTEDTPDAFITSYVIKSKLKPLGNSIVAFIPNSPDDGFSIITQVKAYKKNPTAPEFSTDAFIKDFTVGVVQAGSDYVINIDFKHIRFTTTAGKKADVSVEMQGSGIRFGGPLSFINEITKLIDPKGFSDPPYLDVSVFGIKCGYTLALPNLQLGAFTLSNLSLGAEVNLPFSGGPLTVGFRFCERQQPFTLTVSCLGGGGFFGLELDLNGLRQVEAALEFGAAVSINLGVASGSVSIMAGIYFKMEFKNNQNDTTLTGYVRINGAVSVLGLITASIELYLALTYKSAIGKAYGEASLKIKIEILFFSTSVTIYTQKTFAGSGDDPNFKMSLTQGDWQEYCAAFAA